MCDIREIKITKPFDVDIISYLLANLNLYSGGYSY